MTGSVLSYDSIISLSTLLSATKNYSLPLGLANSVLYFETLVSLKLTLTDCLSLQERQQQPVPTSTSLVPPEPFSFLDCQLLNLLPKNK